ncbi:EAL domain-containing protein, partial [Ruminococcaceae bacterium OttesenSCG-928-L11]|nr:EAL domain-containing protein [Ruminococcaceae bacterium OttesenSCG-928-L11]
LSILERHGFPCRNVLLEITESTEFTFNEVTIPALSKLREKGIQFALDDFGSGYSGFSNLKNLPVDMLKTEREFIDNIENDSYLQYFYYIMAETAHANGMQLIAEGVETCEQLRSVVKNGADLIQGYLFGRPMDYASLQKQLVNFAEPLPEFQGWQSSMADFQHWLNGHEAYKITPSLFRLQSKCIRVILDEPNLDVAVNAILEIVGTYFKVNRVYVFLRDEGTIFSNRYEWCADGIESQIALFQGIDGSRDGFYDVLLAHEVVIAGRAGQLPVGLQDRLREGQQPEAVQSIVVTPMKQKDEIIGFVGFDDDVDRDWTPEELLILHNLCLLCLIILARGNGEEG